MHPVLLFLFGFFLLYLGGELLVRGSISLALKIGISNLVVGITVLSFATSAPELFVSLDAALSGSSNIAFGNIIGSNIANISLVLGITAIICNIPIDKKTSSLVFPIAFIISIILSVILFSTGSFSRILGIISVISLFVFLFMIVRISKKEHKDMQNINTHETSGQTKLSVLLSILFLVVGVILLKYGADWLVDGAVYIAKSLNISDTIIAVTIVAIGTSSPEIVTSVIAAFKNQTDLAIGNLIGSNIFNILAVLGITSIITELSVEDFRIILFDIPWMVGITLLLGFFIYNSKDAVIKRKEGVLMLLLYIVYIITSLDFM